MPRRRAVRMIRHAISPRLAIRRRSIKACASLAPGRLALLEEGGDAFAPFIRCARLGDRAGGERHQSFIDDAAGDLADKTLRPRLGARPACEQRRYDALDG